VKPDLLGQMVVPAVWLSRWSRCGPVFRHLPSSRRGRFRGTVTEWSCPAIGRTHPARMVRWRFAAPRRRYRVGRSPHAGASPLVILSKADQVESTTDAEREILADDPAADIVAVSSVTSDGVAELLGRCANRTLVLVGVSGAGKSTLLNALAGRELGTTGRVRAGDSKGRHTTTARQLYLLEGNCCLIDTPGVREVGLFTDVDTIDDGFSDIAKLALDCRFNNCGHSGEPGCAVAAAVTDGELSETRVQAWDKLRREAAWLERRTDPAAENRAGKALNKKIRDAQTTKRPKN
jgi:ribosome biogenesis GTPase / thiamine phosphate phosphatase